MNEIKEKAVILPGRGSAPFRKISEQTTKQTIVYEGPPQSELSVVVVEPDERVRNCLMRFCKEANIACRAIYIAGDKVTAIAYVNEGSCSAVITNVLMFDGAGFQPEPTVSHSRVFGRYVERHKPNYTRLHYVLGDLNDSLRRYAKDLCPANSDTVPFTTNGHMISPQIDGVGIPTSDGCKALFRCLFIMHELRARRLAHESCAKLTGFRFGDREHNCRFVLNKRPDPLIKDVLKKYHVL